MHASHNNSDGAPARNVWIDELLVSTANPTAYQLVYEGETWVRRICLAAFMLEEGPAWASSLRGRLREQLESRSRNNSEYWYLGVDARLKDGLGLVSQLILCVKANKLGDELTIALPRKLPTDDQIAVVDRFFDVATNPHTWIETSPEYQHPADVGWARLWFYEKPER